MNLCQFQPIEGGGWHCPRCGKPTRHRGSDAPKRPCGNPPPKPTLRIFNDLSRGPCIHRGETLREEPCQFCGQKNKLVPIFACNSPNAPAPEVSEARWGYAQPRSETCGGCGSYSPAPSATSPEA